ncbi:MULTISPECIES: DUF421 domain-containing protein [unclassified Paenibacillus]|uniref:DUF421 domain-containing protein n=1 Tax=Paenibacillus provencensis TaxID=441151 RepID=A0ABW3PSS1_9BACL|nr:MULTISPECIES: DUF421 domain-containing protein [unclassified Paenibacillus]MCM3131028.1 DUF421 domain-containing protein [Paenibacillus sp. MER 78]SFS55188.1 Uncharacterized membrane protein YcaP, DUF421 family [Paenibacillus sp. 453mf]
MPDWLEVSLRTLAAVTTLFIITKILGKRQISELSLFEYITGITLGNLVGYISLDIDNTWFLGFIALFVWVAVSTGAEYYTMKNKKFRDIVDGKATVLVEKGVLLGENLKKERLTIDEFLEQLRKKNVFRVADVEFAVMEQSGDINVMLKKEHQPLTANILGYQLSSEREPITIIIDGHILPDTLRASGYDEKWLYKELRKLDLTLDQVFVGQVDNKGELTVQSGKEGLPKQTLLKPKDQISELVNELQNDLTVRKQFALNEKEKFEYQQALDQLKNAMHAFIK